MDTSPLKVKKNPLPDIRRYFYKHCQMHVRFLITLLFTLFIGSANAKPLSYLKHRLDMGDTLENVMGDAITFARNIAVTHPNIRESSCFGGTCSLQAEAETLYLQFGPVLARLKGIFKITSHGLPVSIGRNPGLYMDSLLTGEPSVTFKINGVKIDAFNVKKIRFIESVDNRLGIPDGYDINDSIGFEFYTGKENIRPHLKSIPKETPFALTVTSNASAHQVVCVKSKNGSLNILDNYKLTILKPNKSKTLDERITDYFLNESSVKDFFENGVEWWQVIENNYPHNYDDPRPTCDL